VPAVSGRLPGQNRLRHCSRQRPRTGGREYWLADLPQQRHADLQGNGLTGGRLTGLLASSGQGLSAGSKKGGRLRRGRGLDGFGERSSRRLSCWQASVTARQQRSQGRASSGMWRANRAEKRVGGHEATCDNGTVTWRGQGKRAPVKIAVQLLEGHAGRGIRRSRQSRRKPVIRTPSKLKSPRPVHNWINA